MLIAETDFDEAEKRFKEFLGSNGFDTELLWLFEEDVFTRNVNYFSKDFWVRLPLPSENRELTKRQYELGREKGFGIALTAFATCEGKPCCGLLIPVDDEDAQYMQISPTKLKFSFTTNPTPVAKPVRSALVWAALKSLPFWYKPGCLFVYLASKRSLTDAAA